MRNLTSLFTALSCAVILVLFINSSQKDIQQDSPEPFVIVEYSTQTEKILIYHGGTKTEEIKTKARLFNNSNSKNEVIDVLNSLNEKGYSLTSSTANTFVVGEGFNYVEYNYVFRK